ncbi:MAG: hypothetical protein ABI882_18590 [Acidobacteriota bacterium]
MSRKLHIAVGIPSFEEADSIAHVTEQVDIGLTQLATSADCIIINADGGSLDGTSDVFLSTPTVCSKLSLITPGHIGKGSNVLSLLEYCRDHDVDALALIDGDIRSLTPAWPIALTRSILSGEADYVAPNYRRRRFEGATTNHFAYPLLRSYFGRGIRQPIGGEFGLSTALIKYLLDQPIERETMGYGIDIFMSMHAVAGGFAIAQADLGSKLHKPSFRKAPRIFPDVAATAFRVARRYPMNAGVGYSESVSIGIDDTPGGLDEEDVRLAISESLERIEALMPVYEEWLGKTPVEMTAELRTHTPFLSAGVWAELAASCAVCAILAPTADDSRLFAAQLFPAFRLRSISFIRDHRDSRPEVVEAEIEFQRNIFGETLRGRMSQGRNPNSA